MKPYITHPLAVVIRPEGEPIFSEMATTVRIDDESGGPFVVVEQSGHVDKVGRIAINRDEWPGMRDAIEAMLAQCAAIDAENGEIV